MIYLRDAWCRHSPYCGHLQRSSHPEWSDSQCPLLIGHPSSHSVDLLLGALPSSVLCRPPWPCDPTNLPRTRSPPLLWGVPLTYVYLAFNANTGGTPLSTKRLFLLHSADHVSWTSHYFFDTLDRIQARPKSQAVLLMGVLRALWDIKPHWQSPCLSTTYRTRPW